MFVPIRRASRAVLLLSAVVVLALSGCSGGDDGSSDDATSEPTAASSTPTTPAVAPAPPGDACYALTPAHLGEAHSEVAPVSCRARHTTQTYRIGRLGSSVDVADAAAVATAADDQCRRALRGFVGASAARLALSRTTYAWFAPTEADLADGARWVRCDVAVSRTDSTLLRLPRDAKGMLDDDGALDRFGRCARTNQAGVAAGRGGRVCDLPHTWRAISARRLGAAGDPFPGAEVRGDVLGRCEDAARAFTDNATSDIDVGWLPPTRAQWAQGERFGLCWTRTKA